jgi:ABC-2 type transport system permease protein
MVRVPHTVINTAPHRWRHAQISVNSTKIMISSPCKRPHCQLRIPPFCFIVSALMSPETKESNDGSAAADAVSAGRRPSRLGRYLTIYGALWRTSVTREMSFKGNFILWIVVELAWFALQLCFVGVIFSQTSTVGTWSAWQVVLLTGTSNFIQQIYQAFFLVNCTNLSELVRTGKMDFLLLLPVNTRFLVSMRQVDIPSFANAAFAACVMGYSAHKLNLHPTVLQFAGFGVLCLVGLLVHYSLMFMLASVSFWTVRAQGIVWGYYNLFNIARLPDEAFKGVFKAVFTFALPVLLVSNVPVRVLADKLTSPIALSALFGLGVLWAIISEWFWRLSLRHYTSAST